MEILVTMLRSKVGALICALLAFPAWAIDADDLADLVGYTIVAATQVPGEFEGADFDKVVKLENGMVFEFLDYSYSYSYRPTVVVLARRLSGGGSQENNAQ